MCANTGCGEPFRGRPRNWRLDTPTVFRPTSGTWANSAVTCAAVRGGNSGGLAVTGAAGAGRGAAAIASRSARAGAGAGGAATGAGVTTGAGGPAGGAARAATGGRVAADGRTPAA